MADALEPIKNDDEKVREYGIVQAVEQCQELIDNGTRFLHFYTMNLEAAILKTIKELGIMKDRKALPFSMANSAGRKGEEVRPIFWANKPSSYLKKTSQWDEYPNGRWGVSRSPAFNNDDGFVSYSKKFTTTNVEDKKKQWGATCTSLQDISNAFVSFVTGKIKKLPFSEGTMAVESEDINEVLVQLNSNKLLTINSQPRVNGAKSTDAKFGWGPENGYVYQKAYFELFVHPSLIKDLVTYLEQFPSITFQAMNLAGEKHQNVTDDDVNAVTWGVFRGREIVQPTVVDHQAFEIWKNEALKSFVDTWSIIYQGEAGDAGDNGANGERGVQGPRGPEGDRGADGAQGEDGEAGADGVQGQKGPQGPRGAEGAPGNDGAQGPQGDKGPRGARGPRGDPGNDGAQGPDGPDGQPGDQGAQGPKGPSGLYALIGGCEGEACAEYGDQ